MNTAPIALFVYNRPHHTRKTLDALAANAFARDSDLFVFSDAPRTDADAEAVGQVRQLLASVKGFRSVTVLKRSLNYGLAKSIIEGVSEVCAQYGRVIVLEDDLVTSPYFLSYMNEGLQRYEGEPDVVSIHGYVYPTADNLPETFFLRGADCWGWATWSSAWQHFEPDGAKLLKSLTADPKLVSLFNFDNTTDYIGMLEGQISGKNNSWAIRWYASAFLLNKFTLYPGKSLVFNIGNDGSGTHSIPTDVFSGELATKPVKIEAIPIADHAVARSAFAGYFRRGRRSLVKRILLRLRNLMKSASGR